MMRPMTCLMVLLISACATERAPPVRYDFGGGSRPIPSQARLDTTIAIPPIASPPWLRTTAVTYRLDYEAPTHPGAYALSAWMAPPDVLLTLRLRQWVEAANSGVTLRQTPSDPQAYSLEVSLDTFTQVFSASDRSRCVVALRATLLAHDDEVLAQKTFSAQRPAPSPDAAGGVEGLVDASDADIGKILTWLHETLQAHSTRATACESGVHPPSTASATRHAHGRPLSARANKNKHEPAS